MTEMHPKSTAITSAPNPQEILTASRESLEKHREIIIGHERKFSSLTLGPRLQMGLSCLKAYQVFILNPGKGGRPKKTVTRDGFHGFEPWLESECPWLKKPTAYKYMTAVRGLGLSYTATEKQVAHALKMRLRRGEVTLKSLCDASVEALGPPKPPEPDMQQSEFDFICDGLKAFRVQGESICALKVQLESNPELYKVACARAYTILYELTGTNWKPSDEPDDLAFVDPDSITL